MTPATIKNLLIFHDLLFKCYGELECALYYNEPHELMVAAMLSAQCTDKRVNIITKTLFDKYRTIKAFADAGITELENDIRTAGLFRAKAKNINAACKIIMTQFNGQVPHTMAELKSLPGLGRKTANVVLGNAFDIPGFPVDTHVQRVLNRFGTVDSKYPGKIEKEVTAVIPDRLWTNFSHLIITHGRQTCQARKPDCGNCPANNICKYGEKQK
jgi:endonuclease III